MSLSIGDTIYQFDENRRVYPKDGAGGPIFREHFVTHKITGETKFSWLVFEGNRPRKINKKTLREARPGWNPIQWYTTEGMKDRCWIAENAHRIREQVRMCREPEILREIETIFDRRKINPAQTAEEAWAVKDKARRPLPLRLVPDGEHAAKSLARQLNTGRGTERFKAVPVLIIETTEEEG